MGNLAVNGGTKVRTKPFPSWPIWDEEDAHAVGEVVRSGAWGIPRGTKVAEFEETFAQFHNARCGVCTPSGTSALETALRACGVGLGDEVITSPYTFIATASAIFHVGAVPVFADILPGSFNLDPALIESTITPHTRAVMPVQVAGCPADMDGVLSVCRKHSLPVIEDASQAHGAQWKGKGVGSIGDSGTFSFQSTKNLTCGEGGIVLTNDEALYDRVYAFHFVGAKKDGSRFEPAVLGTNLRMTELQAALLLSQMRRLPEQIRLREENAGYLVRELEKFTLKAQERDRRITTHAWHLFLFRYQGGEFQGISRDRFVEALRAEGVPCASGYTPLYRNPVWKTDRHVQAVLQRHPRTVDFAKIDLPHCERACREAVWIPQNVLLGARADMQSIVDAVEKIHEHAEELKPMPRH